MCPVVKIHEIRAMQGLYHHPMGSMVVMACQTGVCRCRAHELQNTCRSPRKISEVTGENPKSFKYIQVSEVC